MRVPKKHVAVGTVMDVMLTMCGLGYALPPPKVGKGIATDRRVPFVYTVDKFLREGRTMRVLPKHFLMRVVRVLKFG